MPLNLENPRRRTSDNDTRAATDKAMSPSRTAPTWWVWLSVLPILSLFILSNAATPLYTVWQQRMGFSDGTLTQIFVIYIAGLLVSLLLTGPVSDRLGRKPVLVPALALSLVSCALFVAAADVTVLLVARLVTGVCVGAVASCGMAAVTDLAGAQRGKLAALLASSAIVLGSGIGPLFGGALTDAVDEPVAPVFLTVLVLLAASLLIAIKMPLSPHPQRGGPFIRLPSVPRQQVPHLALGIAVFAPGLVGGSFLLALSPSLLYSLRPGSTALTAGALVFVAFAAATAIQFAARPLALPVTLATSACATLAGMAALFAAASAHFLPALYAAAALIGAGQGAGQLAGFTLLNTTVPRHRLAAANASLSMGAYLPAAACTLAAGLASDTLGIDTSTQLLTAPLLLVTAATAATIAVQRHRLPTSD